MRLHPGLNRTGQQKGRSGQCKRQQPIGLVRPRVFKEAHLIEVDTAELTFEGIEGWGIDSFLGQMIPSIDDTRRKKMKPEVPVAMLLRKSP